MRWLATSLVFLLLSIWSSHAFAHDHWCHRWHVCPSDDGSYVCGDMGVCGQCPDNDYCKDNKPIKPKNKPLLKELKKLRKETREPEVKIEKKSTTPPKSVSSPSPPKSFNTKELFKRTRDSVVLIMSFDSNNQPLAIGSGFYVDDGSKIATNLHVVSGAQIVKVKNPDGKVFRASILLGLDSTHDLALLEADVSGIPIPLSQRIPEIGEDIIAIGNPKGLEATLSKGIVSGVRNDQESVFYQVTAPISPGSSGGPVIDGNGEVVGVSTFYVQGGQNLNFAVPSEYIHKLLRFPNRMSLASISKREPSRTVKVANENVKVVDFIVNGYSEKLEVSIFNGNAFSIKNIRLLVIYYSKTSGQYPVHYDLVKINEVVPPSLSFRFSERDYKIRIGWTAKFRILDYDIVQQAGGIETIPAFE